MACHSGWRARISPPPGRGRSAAAGRRVGVNIASRPCWHRQLYGHQSPSGHSCIFQPERRAGGSVPWSAYFPVPLDPAERPATPIDPESVWVGTGRAPDRWGRPGEGCLSLPLPLYSTCSGALLPEQQQVPTRLKAGRRRPRAGSHFSGDSPSSSRTESCTSAPHISQQAGHCPRCMAT